MPELVNDGIHTDAFATRWVRRQYQRWVRARVRDPLLRQRLKLLWFMWGYMPLFRLRTLSLAGRIGLIGRFVRIDWSVEHAHTPGEIAQVCLAIGERRARANETVVEAGCWQGGSSAKFSIACQLFGYTLRVYDSFAGVESLTPAQIGGGFDFSGTYAASEGLVRDHIARFGVSDVCSFHPGWFSETLARSPVTVPVRVAYIDCDVAKGTHEALTGIMPALTPDGAVFSQDYHIEPVTRLLSSADTWQPYQRGRPVLRQLSARLVRVSFVRAESS